VLTLLTRRQGAGRLDEAQARAVDQLRLDEQRHQSALAAAATFATWAPPAMDEERAARLRALYRARERHEPLVLAVEDQTPAPMSLEDLRSHDPAHEALQLPAPAMVVTAAAPGAGGLVELMSGIAPLDEWYVEDAREAERVGRIFAQLYVDDPSLQALRQPGSDSLAAALWGGGEASRGVSLGARSEAPYGAGLPMGLNSFGGPTWSTSGLSATRIGNVPLSPMAISPVTAPPLMPANPRLAAPRYGSGLSQ
jgi:hypothetical protein